MTALETVVAAGQQASDVADRMLMLRWRKKCHDSQSRPIRDVEIYTRHAKTADEAKRYLRRLIENRNAVHAVSHSKHAHVTAEFARALSWLENGDV
jgi:hypothetical protein